MNPEPSREPVQEKDAGPSPKVFCIGFNKTGTTSVLHAFKLLGIEPAASPKTLTGGRALNLAALRGEFETHVEAARHYRCFKDRPWNIGRCYEAMDRAFPGSRFVLTRRAEEAWWTSVHRWLTVEKPRLIPLYLAHLGADTFSREPFIEGYRRHNEGIRRYFSGRGNLLELDPGCETAWEDLCGFLGEPVPSVPFPFVNRQQYEQGMLASPVDAPRVFRFDAGGI